MWFHLMVSVDSELHHSSSLLDAFAQTFDDFINILQPHVLHVWRLDLHDNTQQLLLSLKVRNEELLLSIYFTTLQKISVTFRHLLQNCMVLYPLSLPHT